MANSLNLNLEHGEAVQLTNNQIVYCQSGFGMMSSTIGTALFVADKKGNTFRVSGEDIKCLVHSRVDEVLQAIIDLKVLARKHITGFPATFHAIDVAERIAGWERAAQAGDTSFDLAKKVRQIYQEDL